jgi:type IV pilus assembly protein PilC
MLSANLLLIDSLRILHKQSDNPHFQTVLDDIIQQLNFGNSFYLALQQFPRFFNQYYLNLIEVGEMTGKLDEMLLQIYSQLEKISDLKRKLFQAITYPILVIIVAILSLSFIINFVIPTFSGILTDFNSDLPWITRSVLDISSFLEKYIIYLFIMLIITFALLYKIRTISPIKIFMDRIIFYIPIWGGFLQKNYISQFCRTLGSMLICKIPLITALHTASNLLSNNQIKLDIRQMINFINKGDGLASSINQSQIFPFMVAQMIAIGEETAELPKILLKIAEYYDKEVNSSLDLLSSVLEPVIILVLGSLVGLILISLYLPLFNFSEGMSF